MPRSTNRRVVQFVEETVIGQDPGSGYVALVVDGETMPTSGAVVTPRATVQPSFSKKKPVVSQRQWSVPYNLEMKGGGISGSLTPPPMDPMLRAAAMERTGGFQIIGTATGTFQTGEEVQNTTQTNEVVGYVIASSATELLIYNKAANVPVASDVLTGSVSAATITITTVTETLVYQPWSIREQMKTATIKDYVDGLLTNLSGARATVQFDFSHPTKPMANFAFQGLYLSPTDTPNPASVSYSSIEAPDCFPAVMTLSGSDLSNVAIQNISFITDNQIVLRPDIKAADALIGFEITDRASPTITFDPEVANALSEFNAHELWTSRTDNVLSLTVGTTPGNIIRCVAPNAVFDEVSFANRDNLLAYGITAGMYETEGVDDAEFFLIFS